jgi:alpha-tubulin suppressor-like RCC1 family protein
MQGDIYAWGRGGGGRLGLNTEEDVCTPKGKFEEIYHKY